MKRAAFLDYRAFEVYAMRDDAKIFSLEEKVLLIMRMGFLMFKGFSYKISRAFFLGSSIFSRYDLFLKKFPKIFFLFWRFHEEKFYDFYEKTRDNRLIDLVLSQISNPNDFCVSKEKLFFYADDIRTKCLFDTKFYRLKVVSVDEWLHLDKTGFTKEVANQGQFFFSDPFVPGNSALSSHYELEEPKAFIACLTNVTVGDSASVLAEREGIFYWISYEDQAHPRYAFVSGYWNQFIFYNDKKNILFTPKKKRVVIKIKEAILINGRCSPNYFHWIIEYLSRYFAIDKFDQDLSQTPLLVDDCMPSQHYEALRAVVGEHPVFYNSINQDIQVEKLYVLSVPTNHYDDLNIPYWKGSSTRVDYLRWLQKRVFYSKDYQHFLSIPKIAHSKIFVTRKKGNIRALINQAQIERHLVNKGFTLVYPETLSFIEQVFYFSQADVVIGVNGAAMTNLIFVKPSARVIILISKNNEEYPVQFNLAKVVANCAEVFQVSGVNVKTSRKARTPYEEKMIKASQDYKISLTDLDRVL